MVLFIDEQNIVNDVDFDRGISTYSGAATKVEQINCVRKDSSTSCGNPKCSPDNVLHKRSIDKEYTSSAILNPYIL